MKVKVEIHEHDMTTKVFIKSYEGVVDLPSDHLTHPCDFRDRDNKPIATNVLARSDRKDHFQLLFERKEEDVSFDFSALETGKERILFVGRGARTFTKSPWRVSVTKRED